MTTNFYQEVTGAYLLTDWVLMRVLGAADWALRLPSLVFGVLFIVYSLTFLRPKVAGTFGLTLLHVLLITQELVLHYVGEARTYTVLAEATIAPLTYDSGTPSGERPSPPKRPAGQRPSLARYLTPMSLSIGQRCSSSTIGPSTADNDRRRISPKHCL